MIKRSEFVPFFIVFSIYAFYVFTGFAENKNNRVFEVANQEIEEIHRQEDGSISIKLNPETTDRLKNHTGSNIGKKLQIFLDKKFKIIEATISAEIDSGIIHIKTPSNRLIQKINTLSPKIKK